MTVSAVVRRVAPETPRLSSVLLEVDAEVADAFERPGQYVKLHLGEVSFPLAIASAPGEARALELLFEVRDPELVREGATVQIDPPAGPGFDLAPAAGRDVLLFAVGSGLSAVRPIIEVIRRRRADYGRVTLFYGARSQEEQVYAGHDAAWAADDIEIRRGNGRPWVQARFAERPVPVQEAVAYLCGMKGMIDGVKAALLERGLPPERILLNW